MTPYLIAWLALGLITAPVLVSWDIWADSSNNPPLPAVRGLIFLLGVALAPLITLACALFLLGLVVRPNYRTHKEHANA